MIKVKRLTPGVLLNQAAGYVQYLKFKRTSFGPYLVSDLSIHAKKGLKYLVSNFVKVSPGYILKN